MLPITGIAGRPSNSTTNQTRCARDVREQAGRRFACYTHFLTPSSLIITLLLDINLCDLPECQKTPNFSFTLTGQPSTSPLTPGARFH